jgi:hypothetical protein
MSLVGGSGDENDARPDTARCCRRSTSDVIRCVAHVKMAHSACPTTRPLTTHVRCDSPGTTQTTDVRLGGQSNSILGSARTSLDAFLRALDPPLFFLELRRRPCDSFGRDEQAISRTASS